MQEDLKRVFIQQMMFQILYENLQLKNVLNLESKNWNHKVKSTKTHFITDKRTQMYWVINQLQAIIILTTKKTKILAYLNQAREEALNNPKMVEFQANKRCEIIHTIPLIKEWQELKVSQNLQENMEGMEFKKIKIKKIVLDQDSQDRGRNRVLDQYNHLN